MQLSMSLLSGGLCRDDSMLLQREAEAFVHLCDSYVAVAGLFERTLGHHLPHNVRDPLCPGLHAPEDTNQVALATPLLQPLRHRHIPCTEQHSCRPLHGRG